MEAGQKVPDDLLFEILATLFQVRPEEITNDSSPESIASWDSLQHLNLVLALEEVFKIHLEPKEIDEMQNVGQIKQILRNRGIEFRA